jgi:hypothetical protein
MAFVGKQARQLSRTRIRPSSRRAQSRNMPPFPEPQRGSPINSRAVERGTSGTPGNATALDSNHSVVVQCGGRAVRRETSGNISPALSGYVRQNQTKSNQPLSIPASNRTPFLSARFGAWSFVVSLVLGAWCLVLPAKPVLLLSNQIQPI